MLGATQSFRRVRRAQLTTYHSQHIFLEHIPLPRMDLLRTFDGVTGIVTESAGRDDPDPDPLTRCSRGEERVPGWDQRCYGCVSGRFLYFFTSSLPHVLLSSSPPSSRSLFLISQHPRFFTWPFRLRDESHSPTVKLRLLFVRISLPHLTLNSHGTHR
jgi:hypothetical protein